MLLFSFCFFQFFFCFFKFSQFFRSKQYTWHCSQYLHLRLCCYRISGIRSAGYSANETGYQARYRISKKAGYPVQPYPLPTFISVLLYVFRRIPVFIFIFRSVFSSACPICLSFCLSWLLPFLSVFSSPTPFFYVLLLVFLSAGLLVPFSNTRVGTVSSLLRTLLPLLWVSETLRK